jgi:(p)ppGpp synthase/HD superfamily hydrolase
MSSQKEENKKQLNFELPNDSNSLTKSIKNIFLALNKANRAGIFELQESSQIMNDINLLSTVVNQIVSLVYNQQKENQEKSNQITPALSQVLDSSNQSPLTSNKK